MEQLVSQHLQLPQGAVAGVDLHRTVVGPDFIRLPRICPPAILQIQDARLEKPEQVWCSGVAEVLHLVRRIDVNHQFEKLASGLTP